MATAGATFISLKKAKPFAQSRWWRGEHQWRKPNRLRRLRPANMNTIEKSADSLARFTSPALVVPQLCEQSPAGVARELNGLLHRHAALPESFFLTPAALCRELLTNTSLDCGMLIAQVRSTPVTRSCFALGRAREPLPWRAQWLTPVEFICVAVEPSRKMGEYGRVMTALTRLAGHSEAILELRAAKGVDDMLTILERFS